MTISPRRDAESQVLAFEKKWSDFFEGEYNFFHRNGYCKSFDLSLDDNGNPINPDDLETSKCLLQPMAE